MSGDDERQRLFDGNVDRLVEMAYRAVNVLKMDPSEAAVVAINADDPAWTEVVETLMPGEDWQKYRDQGLLPIARGSVMWSTVEYICAVCPDISAILERETTQGHLYALVMAEGGVSVYEVPYTGADA